MNSHLHAVLAPTDPKGVRMPVSKSRDMSGNVALITGVTGQNGSFLAELLLEKGYDVHGTIRYSSANYRQNIGHLEGLPHFHLHFADISDTLAMARVVSLVRPTEIYNLASLSDSVASWQVPVTTMQTDGMGVLCILQSLNVFGLQNSCRVFHACSSAIYDQSKSIEIGREAHLHPSSPLATSKLYGYEVVRDYRDAYNVFCCSGILFPHESERSMKSSTFRSVINAVVEVVKGKKDYFCVHSFEDSYDWGYSKDYVEGMWQMLQADQPADHIIATGRQHTVRELCRLAFLNMGVTIEFKGKGIYEKGVDVSTGNVLVKILEKASKHCEHVQRPTPLPTIVDGWHAKTSFEELVRIVVEQMRTAN